MEEPATWAALIGLGAFHGLNPSMGWLFAVARGMQQRRRRAVLGALPPLALGHAAAILATLAAVALLGLVVPPDVLAVAAGVVLVGFGLWLLITHHQPHWTGMRVGPVKLALWSFLMATGHGAGLMLIPVVLHGNLDVARAADHAHGHSHNLEGTLAGSQLVWLTGAHTVAMFVVMAAIAVVVYQVAGLRLLRRGWVNLDLVWALALIVAGVVAMGLAMLA